MTAEVDRIHILRTARETELENRVKQLEALLGDAVVRLNVLSELAERVTEFEAKLKEPCGKCGEVRE